MFEGLKYPTNHRSPKNVSGYQKIQPFNTNEIMRAIWAQIEHRGPRNSLKAGQYFRALDIKNTSERKRIGRLRRWGLAYRRFMTLCAYLDGNLEEMAKVISAKSRDLVSIRGSWAIDESLIACKISAAPTVWLERKPHPVGLRNFLTCLKFPFTDRTFCVQLLPDYGLTSKLGVREILEASFSVARCLQQPVAMTADAWFSVKDFFDVSNTKIQQNKFIVSFNKARCKECWQVMQFALPPGHFRMALHKSGKLLASVFLDAGEMRILTNCILPHQHHPSSSSSSVTLEVEQPAESEPTAEEPTEVVVEFIQGLCVLCHSIGPNNADDRGYLFSCMTCGSKFHRRDCSYRSTPFAGVNFCQRECRQNWLTYVRDELSFPVEEAEEAPAVEPSTPVTDKAAKRIASLPRFVIQELATANNIDPTMSNREIAYLIGGHAQAPPEEGADSPPPPLPTKPQDTQSSSPESSLLSASSSSSSSSSAPAEQPAWNEELARAALQQLSLQSLKARALKYGLKPKSEKSALIEQVLLAEIPEDMCQAIIDQCFNETKYCKPAGGSTPYVHLSYKQRFNSVDTFDKRIYEIWMRYKTQNWRFTAILGFMWTTLCNVHAWDEEYRCLSANVGLQLRGDTDIFVPKTASEFVVYILDLKRKQLGLEKDPTYFHPYPPPSPKKQKRSMK